MPKKPPKRPGAKTISKLTDAQRRTLLRRYKELEVKAAAIKTISLTPAAKKQVQGEIDAILKQIRRASNLAAFG